MSTVYKPPYYTVVCNKHGIDRDKNSNAKTVIVGPPKGKKDRNTSGCPECKKERAQSKS